MFIIHKWNSVFASALFLAFWSWLLTLTWRTSSINMVFASGNGVWLTAFFPPVTIPVLTQYSQADSGYPPLQPKPQLKQQSTMSSADKWNFCSP
ncbi:hypothetical protein BpHYR1_044006 [Brachionus plicatilis]|uniref:Uncharacterized protein n=1 Tax=Brachionus plicatilis TaxID=10195 RepID=A0A3M7PV71_BRAPC|nr:hypothetical protein BpHYR1_044006 [Brachionus plicatilis]